MRQTIYIAAYPKSGSTWLTRLLGDILNSPTGGCIPEEDGTDIVTEGQDRPGPYIVRRGHFVLVDDNDGPVVPVAHRLAWKRLTGERVVFLVRDPRDICVSGAYHWQVSVEQFLERMIVGDVAGCGRWDTYCAKWLSFAHDNYASGKRVIIDQSYEMIFYQNLGLIGNYLKLDFDPCRILSALERQSFAVRAAQIGSDEQELRRNNMRRGVAGDWENHFTPEMNERIQREFGWMMERLGYDY